MNSKIMDLFISSGKVITSPDELFYLRSQGTDNMGVILSIFYSAFIGLIIGILSGNIIITIGVIITLIILTIVTNLINTIFIYIFTHLLKAKGGFFETFNMISYASAIDLVFIVALPLIILKPVLLAVIILVPVWKFIIQITAVNTIYDIGFGRSFLCCGGFLAIIAIIIMGLI